ncbi:hypothetical protein CIRMBP1220_01991 [Enterococcus cecorum]|nr:hypothetical protein CIRMBP1220_01991 [Enterococcus cecorum]
MFIFYWLFQHEGKWLAVFKQENTFIYAEDKGADPLVPFESKNRRHP